MMLRNFSSILLSVTVSEVSNFTDQCIGIAPPQSATPAHRSKQNVTRKNILSIVLHMLKDLNLFRK